MKPIFSNRKTYRSAVWITCLTILLASRASPQTSRTPSPPQNKIVREDTRKAESAATVRVFVERVSAFNDLQTRVVTLTNLASLLWENGQETTAREIFGRLRDQLKTALSTQRPNSKDAVIIMGLQQLLLRYVFRHDPKLAKSWFEEQIAGAGDARGSRQMDFALDLVLDGNGSEASTFAQQAIESSFSALNIRLLLVFLHRLRLRDSAAADTLFIQALGKLGQQSQITGDDLLLIGNYLFISDQDTQSDTIRYTPVRLGDIYFPVGISGERVGLNRQVVVIYLRSALTILAQQLARRDQLQFPARYEAVARLLLMKAEKFAPELINDFGGLAREFRAAGVTEVSSPGSDSGDKPDYDQVAPELEKLQGVERDEKCLRLTATAYAHNDLDVALKLASLLTDDEARGRVKELIEFRRGISLLEKGEGEHVQEILPQLKIAELRIILQLGLATLDLKRNHLTTAVPQLQALVTEVRDTKLDAKGFYLLAASELLSRVEPSLALDVMGDAAKVFSNSTSAAATLSRRDHLSRVRIGKMTAVFPVDSKAVEFGSLSDPILALYRQSPNQTIATVLEIKNEQILGPTLVILAKEVLKKPPVERPN
jgi:hypothetical protein